MVYIYNEILLSHKKNEFESVLMRWMSLEPVIQSEVSQKEKKKYIYVYIWNLEKCYWWTYLQGRNGVADIENELVDTVGEGVSGLNGESSSPLQYSCLENCMDRGAWKATVHGVAKTRTWLSD